MFHVKRGNAHWSYDADAGAWYFGINNPADPPYLTQRHYECIVDLDSQGRLVGIELLQALEPSRKDVSRETEHDHEKKAKALCEIGKGWRDIAAALDEAVKAERERWLKATEPFAKLAQTWPQAAGYWECLVAAYAEGQPEHDFTIQDVRDLAAIRSRGRTENVSRETLQKDG
jgi:uncharacterized protein YuzE